MTPAREKEVRELSQYPAASVAGEAIRDLLAALDAEREKVRLAQTVLENVRAELIDAGERQGIASLVPHTSIFKRVESAIAATRPEADEGKETL